MDLKEYYKDLNKTADELVKQFPEGIVYVTSLFHREKNSTAGSVSSATWRNSARAITDNTHRLSTPEEIKNFLDHQQQELRRNQANEQKNKRQYIVVVDQKEDAVNSGLAVAGGAPKKV